MADSGGTRFTEHRVPIGVERRIIQMGVSVDDRR
jgi:hypothetical protein